MEIKIGEYYEDCRYHPNLCVSVDYENDSIVGISLLIGVEGDCSPFHCGIRKLTEEEAFSLLDTWESGKINTYIDSNC
jgi:hypothetical protein